jgi:dihydropteroate synthase
MMTKLELEQVLHEKKYPVIMGILNITPDSFSDGGAYFSRERALQRAIEMIDEGADIIDIGGESSRPGAVPVSEEEEISRVVPVVEALASQTSVLISVDTYKSGVAERALNAGASILNDISALRFDEYTAETVRKHDAFIVMMHMLNTPQTMQQDPQYENVVNDIVFFLKKRIDYAIERGIPPKRIIIDPGIGFGKTLDHNLQIFKRLECFVELGYPVLIGASRKSMIGKITGSPVQERAWGTAALVAHSVLKGATIHRVHDVKAMRQVCAVAQAIRG